MATKMLHNFKINKFKVLAVSLYSDICTFYLEPYRLFYKYICNLWYPKLVYLTNP